MRNWLEFLKERFPLPAFIFLSLGLAASGSLIAAGAIDWLGAGIAFTGIVWFFGILRLADEVRDYERDLVAYPSRPLPRGVVGREQVKRVVTALVFGMMGFASFTGIFISKIAAIDYLLVMAWLWLNYHGFFLGERLSRRPLLDALAHQLIIFPLCAFSVLVHDGELVTHASTWYFGLLVFGAFFAYDVARKLEPGAHPVLRTYLSAFGRARTFLLFVAVNGVAAIGAYHMALKLYLWPLELLVAASGLILFIAPQRFKLVKTLAGISLLLHIWGVALSYLVIFMA